MSRTATVTPSQAEAYRRDGFLVLERFVDPERCAELVARAGELVEAFDPSEHRSVFTTNEQTRTSDDYFLESGGEIRFFFEPDAFDEGGNLVAPKERALNKIGHALHDLDPVFDAFSRTPELAAVAHAVGLQHPLLLQSMYLFKQPHIGGEVGCHQDATFLFTEPITVTGFWFALEDATVRNGCLWAAPGGHRTTLRQRFERAAGGGTTMVVLDPAPLPAAPDDLVPLEVPAGTLVVLHGLLPHWSAPNRSDRSRHAYSVHVIEAGARYPAANWLQRPDHLPLRGC